MSRLSRSVRPVQCLFLHMPKNSWYHPALPWHLTASPYIGVSGKPLPHRADKCFEIVLSLYPHQCFSYGYSNTKEEGASSQPMKNSNDPILLRNTNLSTLRCLKDFCTSVLHMLYCLFSRMTVGIILSTGNRCNFRLQSIQ